jgi:hypothetical protein
VMQQIGRGAEAVARGQLLGPDGRGNFLEKGSELRFPPRLTRLAGGFQVTESAICDAHVRTTSRTFFAFV